MSRLSQAVQQNEKRRKQQRQPGKAREDEIDGAATMPQSRD